MVSNVQSAASLEAMHAMGTRPIPKPLTDEQKKTVQDILSKYDSSKLSAADAKNIFQSLKDAGIKGGGLREAINASGFDAEQVFSLAHDGQKQAQGAHHGHHHGGKSGGGSQIDATALQSLQTVLNQYDLTNLSADQEKDLSAQLAKTGLLKTGSVVDTGA